MSGNLHLSWQFLSFFAVFQSLEAINWFLIRRCNTIKSGKSGKNYNKENLNKQMKWNQWDFLCFSVFKSNFSLKIIPSLSSPQMYIFNYNIWVIFNKIKRNYISRIILSSFIHHLIIFIIINSVWENVFTHLYHVSRENINGLEDNFITDVMTVIWFFPIK